MIDSLFGELTREPTVAAALTTLLARDGAARGNVSLLDLATLCGLPHSRRSALEYAVDVLVRYGLATRTNDQCRFNSNGEVDFADLAIRLAAVRDYLRDNHRDESTAEIVLTHPPAPSQFTGSLRASGFGSYKIEETNDVLVGLAALARTRFISVTPFLDVAGLTLWLRLLEHLDAAVVPILLLRRTSGHDPLGLIAARAKELRRRNCVVREFCPGDGSQHRETFHAKVFLQDSQAAYVGSANLTTASLTYSLEIGVLVRGEAARTVATVVDAMLRSSFLVNG